MAVVRWAVQRGRTNDPWLAGMLPRKPRMLVACRGAGRPGGARDPGADDEEGELLGSCRHLKGSKAGICRGRGQV